MSFWLCSRDLHIQFEWDNFFHTSECGGCYGVRQIFIAFYLHGVRSFLKRCRRRRRILECKYDSLPGSVDIISILLSFFLISVWIREWHAHRIFTFESKCDQSIGRLAVSVHVCVGKNIMQNLLPKLFFVIVHYFCKLYESSRRKPGWRFTAGSESCLSSKSNTTAVSS